jgi:hypothetical protein
MITKKNKLEYPIIKDKVDRFINSIPNNEVDNSNFLNKTQPVNITLSKTDIFRLEEQIDRAIKLGLRTKNKSALIRMALRSLEQSSDETYIKLYRE